MDPDGKEPIRLFDDMVLTTVSSMGFKVFNQRQAQYLGQTGSRSSALGDGYRLGRC